MHYRDYLYYIHAQLQSVIFPESCVHLVDPTVLCYIKAGNANK